MHACGLPCPWSRTTKGLYMHFRRAEVEAAAESSYTLMPEQFSRP